MSNTANKILIILPTYNESGNIKKIIDELIALKEEIEVLVIDDKSLDNTADIVKDILKTQKKIHLIERAGKFGLGTAYVLGFKWALERNYDFIVQMDADFSHQPLYIPPMLNYMKNYDVDVVVGSRYCAGGGVDKSWGIDRRILSKFGNFYARFFTGIKVRDATSGFKIYKAAALKKIELNSLSADGYAFQIEMAFFCQKVGLKIAEFPIIFYDRTHGVSKMSLSIIWEAIWKVWFMRK